MNKKLGGKSFKFSSSHLPYMKPPPALSHDKQTTEFILSMIFSQILIFNGSKINSIKVNEDDSYHKPDTFINIDGVNKGLQITKLSLNDPLRRINIAEQQTNELLNLFPDDIKIEKPINIYIYINSTDKNSIPKGDLKKKKRIVQFAAEKISENRDKIFGQDPKPIFFPVEDDDLKNLATSITINPVKEGQFSTFAGRKGIHINYEFDMHQWDEKDLNEEIKRIITAKNGGFEDILLIWGDKFEMLYQEQEISEILIDRFLNTGFNEVYFLSINNRIDMFWESWQLSKIK